MEENGFVVEPEPTPEELEALRRALAETAPAGQDDTRGAWWREGLRETLEPDF
jgi:hypothetical protein